MPTLADYSFMANCERQKARVYRTAFGVDRPPTVTLPTSDSLNYLSRTSGEPIKRYGDGLFVDYAGVTWCLPAKHYDSKEVN